MDRGKVQGMLHEVEFVMWQAVEEAALAMNAGELTVDPRVEREARRRGGWGVMAEAGGEREVRVEMSVKL